MSNELLGRGLGWTRRNPKLENKLNVKFLGELPTKKNNKELLPESYDQANIQSSAANAVATLVEVYNKKKEIKAYVPSRLFLYFNDRLGWGLEKIDFGGSISGTIEAVRKYGVAKEKDWYYDVSKVLKKPPQTLYKKALKNKVEFHKLGQDLATLKACIAADKVFVCGVTVYDSFAEGMKTGVVKVPDFNDNELGGLALVVYGYDDETKTFLVTSNYGKEGHFSVPYDYLTNVDLADEFYTI